VLLKVDQQIEEMEDVETYFACRVYADCCSSIRTDCTGDAEYSGDAANNAGCTGDPCAHDAACG
jgi:hypothetical protein